MCYVCIIYSWCITDVYAGFFLVKCFLMCLNHIPMDADYTCCHHTANVQRHLIWMRPTPTHFAGVDGASVHVGSSLWLVVAAIKGSRRRRVITYVCVVRCARCPYYLAWPLASSGPGLDQIGQVQIIEVTGPDVHFLARPFVLYYSRTHCISGPLQPYTRC